MHLAGSGAPDSFALNNLMQAPIAREKTIAIAETKPLALGPIRSIRNNTVLVILVESHDSFRIG
jgi:hypothetical protein